MWTLCACPRFSLPVGGRIRNGWLPCSVIRGQTRVVIDASFVGRRDELARFASLLAGLPAGARRTSVGWRRSRSGPVPAESAKSQVVLVHGLGGSGKSRLLRQFRLMADGNLADSPVPAGRVRTVWLDWEDERRDQPGSYASEAGPGLVTVLDAVQRAIISAFGADRRAVERVERAFGAYRQGAARLPGYAARFAEVIALSRQARSAFTSQDAAALLKSAASTGLLVAGHPGGIAGLAPDQLAASAQAVGHLSEAATRRVTGKRRAEITSEEYNLVTDPARELTRRVAAALRGIAAGVPLVVFLDTGEVIGGGAWAWLRWVMTQTGPRVIWVAGARFETETEAGFENPVAQFVRDIGDEHLAVMSPTRFDDTMIGDYLQSRTGGSYTGAQIGVVGQFTRGLPLAVSFTATLLKQGQAVEDVCRDVDDGYPSSVVSQLARRYLVRAEQQDYLASDPRRHDAARILGLALAYADLRADPDLLAALWNVPNPLATFQDLARRHDFVLPASRRLHDDVRDTLRADLLDPHRRARVRETNQRALGLFITRLTGMRARWPALDNHIGQAGFTAALLSALWHTLWIDNQAGLDLFSAILPVLAVADPRTADAAATMVGRFAETFDQDQRRHLDLLTAIGPGQYVSARDFLEELLGLRRKAAWPVRCVKLTLPGLALLTQGVAASDLQVGEPADREAAVLILRAGLLDADGHDGEAVAALRMAASRTASARLRQAIGSRAESIAARLIAAAREENSLPTATGLDATKIATELLPSSGFAWTTYAMAMEDMSQLEDAVAAYGQAIALRPSLAVAHENKGITLAAMGELDNALAELDSAERLSPDEAGESMTWAGAILWHQRDDAGARDRFTRVKGRLNPWCTPFRRAELEAVALFGLGQPDVAEQHLLDALPRRTPGDLAHPRALYDLLSDPPLPGIDRLRAIVDSHT